MFPLKKNKPKTYLSSVKAGGFWQCVSFELETAPFENAKFFITDFIKITRDDNNENYEVCNSHSDRRKDVEHVEPFFRLVERSPRSVSKDFHRFIGHRILSIVATTRLFVSDPSLGTGWSWRQKVINRWWWLIWFTIRRFLRWTWGRLSWPPLFESCQRSFSHVDPFGFILIDLAFFVSC